MDIDDTLAHTRVLAVKVSGMEGSEPEYPAIALELAQAFQTLDDYVSSGENHPPEQWR
jgi:hypothetical protein